MINEIPGYKQIKKTQEEFYKKRIGTIYGAWKVINIFYDWKNKKQMWTLECVDCGAIKTVNHKNFLKSAMWCSCERKKKEKIIKNKVIYNNDASYLGKIYGNDKVVGFKKSGKSYRWICECQICYKTHLRSPNELKNGKSPKCDCQVNKIKYDDSYIGKKYGRLTVIGFGKQHRFICKCECGVVKEIVSKNVIDGDVVSCGCYADEIRSVRVTTHGDSRAQSTYRRIYRIYRSMINRCYNSNYEKYQDYGGRGIVICDDWKNDYVVFKEWALNHGYQNNLSIDRINVNGNYEPNNCRWTTSQVQSLNRRPLSEWKLRNKKTWTIDGVTKPIIEWCKDYNVGFSTVMYRVNKIGIEPKQALSMKKITLGRPKLNINNVVDKVSSPIESILFDKFKKSMPGNYVLIPQYKILNYTVDFLCINTLNNKIKLVIECDGYKYHGLKEQMIKDNQRQRDIENQGYVVIRFLGSEICQNVDKCIQEIEKKLNFIERITA